MAGQLKLSEFESSLIEENATFSGFSETTVRENLEMTFFRQLTQGMQGHDIQIPFLGSLHIVNNGDAVVDGKRVAQFECLFAPTELFRKVMGDILDGDSEFLADLFQKKIGTILQEKLETGR